MNYDFYNRLRTFNVLYSTHIYGYEVKVSFTGAPKFYDKDKSEITKIYSIINKRCMIKRWINFSMTKFHLDDLNLMIKLECII